MLNRYKSLLITIKSVIYWDYYIVAKSNLKISLWLLVFLLLYSCRHNEQYNNTVSAIKTDSTLIFKPLSANENNYILYVLKLPDVKHDYEDKRVDELLYDTLTSYYIDNYSEINNKINSFHGTPVNFIRFCGYNYSLIVIHKDSIVEEVSVNTDCKFLITEKGAFIYDSVVFDKFISGLNRINVREYRFSDIQIARKQWNRLTIDEPVAIKNYYKPNWIKYDGYFSLINNKDKSKKYIDSATRLQLALSYPTDTFEYTPDFTTIMSSKSFCQKMKLASKSKWTDYTSFTFTVLEKNTNKKPK